MGEQAISIAAKNRSKSVQCSLFDIIFIAVSFLFIYQDALGWSAAGVVTIAHALFLMGAVLFLRHHAARAHPFLGSLLMGIVGLAITAELLINYFTGLHLNRFVLSLTMQPQAAEQIGISEHFLALLLTGVGAIVAGSHFITPSIRITRLKWAAGMFGVLLLSQSLFAYLMYQRDTTLISQRNDMVFFEGMHRYHADLLFSPVLGPAPINPFSQALAPDQTPVTTGAPAWQVTTSRNLLLVVIDSLRAMDLTDDPSLAPNLYEWGKRGYLSLDHNSVSNCTHFGMHTLLTGQLPTSFGRMRRGAQAMGMMASLASAGYEISTAESFTLDWYEISRTYFHGADREVATDVKLVGKDQFVADKTVELLSQKGGAPWAHMAYLGGPHFPYGAPGASEPTAENYRKMVKITDALVGDMLARLETSGALENTLVIVTSDHGEELSENGVLGHGSALNRQQTIVPLLILGANKPTAWIRSHLDLLPFVRGEMGAAPLRATPLDTLVMAGCYYDYPKSFALLDLDAQSRMDFRFNDGLLSPMQTPDSQIASADDYQEAAIRLLKILEQGKIE